LNYGCLDGWVRAADGEQHLATAVEVDNFLVLLHLLQRLAQKLVCSLLALVVAVCRRIAEIFILQRIKQCVRKLSEEKMAGNDSTP
jgi:hypothetical protein